MLCLILSNDYIKHNGIDKIEYLIIVLSSTLGVILMISSYDLIIFYLSLELQSLGLYILAAFNGNTCVGYTDALELPYQLAVDAEGHVVYPLMIYSNDVHNQLRYEAYEKSTGLYYEIDHRD